MAAEVTLKEESALEIGKSLANSFQGLQALVLIQQLAV